MYQWNRSFNIPPGHPRAFDFFWKILNKSPSLSSGRKAFQMPIILSISGDQMPPPPGKSPDYCFNFSVASIVRLKLCV